MGRPAGKRTSGDSFSDTRGEKRTCNDELIVHYHALLNKKLKESLAREEAASKLAVEQHIEKYKKAKQRHLEQCLEKEKAKLHGLFYSLNEKLAMMKALQRTYEDNRDKLTRLVELAAICKTALITEYKGDHSEKLTECSNITSSFDLDQLNSVSSILKVLDEKVNKLNASIITCTRLKDSLANRLLLAKHR